MVVSELEINDIVARLSGSIADGQRAILIVLGEGRRG